VYNHYGVEWNNNSRSKEVIPEFEKYDKDESMLFTDSLEKANFIKSLLVREELFEEMHKLMKIHPTKIYDSFTDYGFISEAGHHYLISNMVISFKLWSEDSNQLKMCMLQAEEHLLAENQTILFADRNDQELVQKIALSYDVSVDFVLDKQNENV
jgi:hypothetical protein